MTIKELRLAKGLSRAAFAEALGISVSSLDSYETGRRNPGAKALAAILDVYGLDLSDPDQDEAAALEAALETAETEELEGEEAEAEESEEETGEAEAEAVTGEAEAEETEIETGETEAEEAEETETGEADAGEAEADMTEAEETEAGEAEAEEPEAQEAETDETEAEAGAADEEPAGESVVMEVTIEEAEPEEPVESNVEAAVAEAIQEAEAAEAAAEAAAQKADEEKAARKAEKKARKAEKLAARQRADEEATRNVIDIITALSDIVGLDDRDAVAAARDAYDSLTDDQELLIPGDVLRALFGAEQKIEAAEEAAAREASKSVPIEECQITVKDVTYTGKKIKKPSVKVVCGEVELEPGADFSVKYDKKTRDIGLYALKVKGKGRFTGSVKMPFYVIPKAASFTGLLDGDKQAEKAWKLLKNLEGFQIEYSRNKDLSDSKKAKIRKPRDLAKVLEKLKAGKKYYLRVRVFTTEKDKQHYSDWSKVKAVKV